eukprot:Sdes_comp18244_c0_seq1m7861
MSSPAPAKAAAPAKKSPTKKPAKPAAAHPPYSQMVAAAITALKEKTGSSVTAIRKYVEDHYKISAQGPHLSRSLKKGVADGKLVKVKASYKLSAAAAKPAKKLTPKKKVAVKKSPKKSPKKTVTPKKTTPKATAVKKSVKAATKKPKSPKKAKSPKKKAAAPKKAKAAKSSTKASPAAASS